MNTKLTRTTISIPEEVLFEVKKRALFERKTIKDVISEGLALYLGLKTNNLYSTPPSINSLFGAWGKGPSGRTLLRKIRYNRKEKERDNYLISLWKKS